MLRSSQEPTNQWIDLQSKTTTMKDRKMKIMPRLELNSILIAFLAYESLN